jgi:hypothetical protein
MNEIFVLKNSVVVKPLISNLVWLSVGIVLFGLIAAVAVLKPQPLVIHDFTFFQQIEKLISSLQLPALTIPVNFNLYILAGAFLALIILSLFDVVLFRKDK